MGSFPLQKLGLLLFFFFLWPWLGMQGLGIGRSIGSAAVRVKSLFLNTPIGYADTSLVSCIHVRLELPVPAAILDQSYCPI